MHSDTPTRLSVISRNSKNEVERAKANKFERLHAEMLACEAEDAKSAGQLGFVAKWLTHAALPYREPQNNPPAWGRRSGDISLMIQPGFYKKEVTTTDTRGRPRLTEEVRSIGYPYGSYPRLLLAWMATEVVKTRERELLLGGSVTEFMLQLGKGNATGGERGTITLLKQQMMRLFSATIAVTTDPEAMQWTNDGFRLLDTSVIETFWAPQDPRQMQLFRTTIKLSERFYSNLITNPVPVDLRILRGLARSPLAIDIYCWLTYRSVTVNRPTLIAWDALNRQFGSESSPHKFKENFTKVLKDVVLVYPGANVKAEKSGLTIGPGKPSIARVARRG